MDEFKMDNLVSTEEKIAEMQAQITELSAELQRERLRKNAYDDGYAIGTQLVATMQGLMDSGMREDHAFSVIIAAMKAGLSH